jgi:hypothetical protein
LGPAPRVAAEADPVAESVASAARAVVSDAMRRWVKEESTVGGYAPSQRHVE